MKISKELLKGSTAIMILKVISEGETYGYRITQELARRSEEVFRLNEGTLYPILHTMEKEGYVESFARRARAAGSGNTTASPRRASCIWRRKRRNGGCLLHR